MNTKHITPRLRAAAALLTLLLVLAACSPKLEGSSGKVTLTARSVAEPAYTLAEGATYSEYTVEFGSLPGEIVYADSTFIASGEAVVTIGYQIDEATIGATVYRADPLKGTFSPFFAETMGIEDTSAAGWDLTAIPTGDGFVVAMQNTLIYFDADFNEGERIDLTDILAEVGQFELIFRPDFKKAAVLMPANDEYTEFAIKMIDFATGEAEDIAHSISVTGPGEAGMPQEVDPDSAPADADEGGSDPLANLLIPVPLSFALDGSLLYRMMDETSYTDAFYIYSTNGTTQEYPLTPELLPELVGPVQFLGGSSNELICQYLGYSSTATQNGLYNIDTGVYTNFSIAGEDIFIWWSEFTPSAFSIQNPLYSIEDPAEDARLTFSRYDPLTDETTLLLGHAPEVDGGALLEAGIPTISFMSTGGGSENYGLAVSPDCKTIYGFSKIDGVLYLGVLSLEK